MQWLNTNTLIGFTEKRGNAWHYRASDQGDEPNHYVGPVPVDDVLRRLFNWHAVEGSIETVYVTDDGVTRISDPTRKAIVRPDTQKVLGVFRPGYQIHHYDEWLVSNVGLIADTDLEIGSAGLLKDGGLAWVQYELPETMQVHGVAFRPFLTAATSLDGSLSSTFKKGATVTVCDNTLAANLAEHSPTVKVKHSAKSLSKIIEVRDTLGLIVAVADNFQAEVESLIETTVSDKAWAAFLDEIAPKAEEDASKRSTGLAERKRAELTTLWEHDDRVAPWKGTGWGALSAVNTWEQHFQDVRNVSRPERNMLNMVEGKFEKSDATTLTTLEKVLAKVA